MSAADKNREKQKRFRERHPNYYKNLRRKKERDKIINYPNFRLPQSDYRTYELTDPRDDERLPRVVGYCHALTKPVWANLWSVRNYSKSKWAAWMRELEANGLEPEERDSIWNVGINIGVNHIIADFAVKWRIGRINTLMGGNLKIPPEFLLRYFPGGPLPIPVGYATDSGEVCHYPSIKAASDATGLHYLAIKARVLEVQTIDDRTWFDD